MTAPTRYTPQKQQELRSIPQIKERLVEFGWLPTRPEEDLGEDLQVHIYFEGKATGVLFHLQAKSITNLPERGKDDFLPYRFKVKDLLHWEQFELPVVLMVWDVNLREGRWVLLHTATAQLDRDNPGWREQKTATVHLPWQNRTDDDGLKSLRRGIGRFLFPQLSRNKSLDIVWEVNPGLENLEAFDLWLKTGQAVTLENVLLQPKYPEWYEQWFGKHNLEKGDFFLPPRSSSIEKPVELSIKDNQGNIVPLSEINLKATEFGSDAMKLSNEHQTTYPLHFTFHFSRVDFETHKFKKSQITITQNNFGSNVSVTRDLLKFMQCLAVGGTLNLTILDPDHYSFPVTVFPTTEIAPNPRFVELVEKLYKLQNMTGILFRVPDEGFTDAKEIQVVEKTLSAFEYGKVITECEEIKITGIREDDLPAILRICSQNKRIRFMPTYEGFINSFLGQDVSLGRVTRHITGNMSVEEIENAMQNTKPDQQISLSMEDVEIIDVFPDCHIKEAERLAKLLPERFEVEAVYLFGSLAWGEQWHPQTDIDLAVRGLAPEKYFKAIGWLEGETKFPFDLITLETAPEFLQERIVSRGRKLYGKELSTISE